MAYHGPNPDRSQRRVTKEQLEASRAAWDHGRFSDEWKPWRHLAAMESGIIDPPTGTRWDSWGDEDPSERAIIIRAIRETPMALRTALLSKRCFTWAQVIRVLLQQRDIAGEDADRREHEWRVIRRDPMVPLGDTLGVVVDSVMRR